MLRFSNIRDFSSVSVLISNILNNLNSSIWQVQLTQDRGFQFMFNLILTYFVAPWHFSDVILELRLCKSSLAVVILNSVLVVESFTCRSYACNFDYWDHEEEEWSHFDSCLNGNVCFAKLSPSPKPSFSLGLRWLCFQLIQPPREVWKNYQTCILPKQKSLVYVSRYQKIFWTWPQPRK